MSSLQETVSNTLKAQANVDDQLRAIFMKHFEVESETADNDAGRKSWALYAVDTAMAIANVLLAIKKPESGRGFRAISDLIYTLNANEFWNRNSPVLVPVLTVILSSHTDYLSLIVERSKMQEYAVYDKLISSAKIVPLEIFSMILYLVGGPMMMAASSLPLKLDLAPYIVD